MKFLVYIFLILTCTLSAPFAHSAKKSAKAIPGPTLAQMVEVVESLSTAMPTLNESQLITQIKSESKNRRPAGLSASKEVEDIEKELWKCNDSECFGRFLNSIDANYDNYSTSGKLVVIHLLPIRAFRGFFWRAKQLFENNSAFIQSRAVTRIRKMATSLSIHIPVDHMAALVDYLAAPYTSVDAQGNPTYEGSRSFTSESDLQRTLIIDLGKELKSSIDRLNALTITAPVIWDNKLLYGPSSFPDNPSRRYNYYGNLERLASLATLYRTAHHLSVMSSYSLDEGLRTAKEVGQLYGFDGFRNLVSNFSQVDGVTPVDVAKTVRRHAGLGKLITTNESGKKTMALALLHASNANKALQVLWKATNGITTPDDNLLQAGFFNIRRNYKEATIALFNDAFDIKLGADKKPIMRDAPIAVRSLITGETILVNLDKIYLDPPNDLKDFYPVTGRNHRKKEVTVRTPAGSSKIEYRDYHEGSPVLYKNHIYKKYFNASNPSEIKRVFRVMADVGGFWALEN